MKQNNPAGSEAHKYMTLKMKVLQSFEYQTPLARGCGVTSEKI
jgi:hypothetical protein